MRVQFLADPSLDDIIVFQHVPSVPSLDQTTFKKAMNSNMQGNRLTTKAVVHEMFASSSYPTELWHLIQKQDLWFNCIAEYHKDWLVVQPAKPVTVSVLAHDRVINCWLAGS